VFSEERPPGVENSRWNGASAALIGLRYFTRKLVDLIGFDGETIFVNIRIVKISFSPPSDGHYVSFVQSYNGNTALAQQAIVDRPMRLEVLPARLLVKVGRVPHGHTLPKAVPALQWQEITLQID
jgi:hypothetical protein